MNRIKFSAIAVTSLVTIATAGAIFRQSLFNFSLAQGTEPFPRKLLILSQAQQNLTGQWELQTGWFYGDGGCVIGSSQPEISIINIAQSGNQFTVNGNGFVYRSRTQYLGLEKGIVSGNKFQGGQELPGLQWLGTIGKDGNEITGNITCGKVSLPFTMKRNPNSNPRSRRLNDAEAKQILDELRERGKREGWTFQVRDSEIFRLAIEVITGAKFPDNFQPQLFDIIDILERLNRDRRIPVDPRPAPPNPRPLPPGQLPTRFDAREWNVVPPIRHQQQCGSCWAFASFGSWETAYSALLGQPNTIDLSEQQLLDCNSANWNCYPGGRVSPDNSDYRNLLDSGLVSEEAYPYQAQKGQCRKFSPPASGNVYRAGAFRFVYQGDPRSQQAIDAIKAAVWSYGSAVVLVSAEDRAFTGYGGGIFNACTNQQTDHLVNIVGWDDAGGYWIMRNSWGQNWGENGYMRITYGCNNIGHIVAVPKQLELLTCSGGNCQSKAPGAPPWLSGPSPAPSPAPQPNGEPTPRPIPDNPPTPQPPPNNPPGWNW